MIAPAHLASVEGILGAFYKVYNKLGFGFLEAHYAAALEIELRALGHRVAREYAVQVMYDDVEIGFHRLDMVIDETLVVELKSGPTLPSHARRQLYNYLRATNLSVGLLLYFGPEPRFQKVFVFKGLGSMSESIKQKQQNDSSPDVSDPGPPA